MIGKGQIQWATLSAQPDPLWQFRLLSHQPVQAPLLRDANEHQIRHAHRH